MLGKSYKDQQDCLLEMSQEPYFEVDSSYFIAPPDNLQR